MSHKAKDQATSTLIAFLNEKGLWNDFVEYLKEQGYSEEEFDKMLES